MKIGAWDGGGFKGVAPAATADKLDEERPGWRDPIDMVAGASTGALQACAYAVGLSGADVLTLYKGRGDAIFASRDFVDKVAGGLDEVFRAGYDGNAGLQAALDETFGQRLFGDLPVKALVPMFDLTDMRPRYAKSWRDPWKDWTVAEVLRATTAAPTYFQGFVGPDSHVYCDGGIFDNSPGASAIAEALVLGCPLEEISLLSFGCGKVPHPGVKGEADWGYKQWLEPPPVLLAALFDGSVDAAVYRAAQQLGARFQRINPELPRVIEMDDPDAYDELVEVGAGVSLEETVAWLDIHWLAAGGVTP